MSARVITTKVSESAIAARIVEWLVDQKWEVYQEVSLGQGYPIADIVATQGPLLWCIETKASLSLQLLGQALYYRRYANWVSIGTPMVSARGRAADAAQCLCY